MEKRLIHKVNYQRTAQPGFLGRNGYGNATALEIMAGTDEIYLTPFTSKGEAARCDIRIPKEAVKAVIAALQELDE